MNKYPLSKKDIAILIELEKNSRISINKIAKKLRLSKDGVNYRIKKLIKNKIITRFFADIDVSKLGLILNKIAFQFQNTDKEKQDEIFNFLKHHPKIGWVVLCSGRWDALIVAYVKDLQEYHKLIKSLNESFGEYIHIKEFIAHPKYYVCSRKWFNPKEKPSISSIGGPINKENLDNKDLTIIKELTKNSRTSIISLAKTLNLSGSAVIKRIKNLETKKIILNYRVGLNLEKIGLEFCKSFIYLKNLTSQKEEAIIRYCLHHPRVTAVTYAIGAWDLELEMEVKNFDEFYKVMNQIRDKFKGNIKNYEAVVINKEYGIDYSTII